METQQNLVWIKEFGLFILPSCQYFKIISYENLHVYLILKRGRHGNTVKCLPHLEEAYCLLCAVVPQYFPGPCEVGTGCQAWEKVVNEEDPVPGQWSNPWMEQSHLEVLWDSSGKKKLELGHGSLPVYLKTVPKPWEVSFTPALVVLLCPCLATSFKEPHAVP